MPPRIDSPSIPEGYFHSEPPAPAVPAAAPRHSLRSSCSSTVSHAIRSGAHNMQRFFASLNCFGSEPLNLDVTTEEGLANYKTAVFGWMLSFSYAAESDERKAVADRINRWLDAGDPTQPLDLSNSNLSSPPPLPSNLQSLNISNAFGFGGLKKYPKAWPAGLRALNISNNNLKKLPDNLPDTLTTLFAGSCSLQSLPKRFPSGLRFLDLGFNKLTNISTPFPDTLEKLSVSNNPLYVLPPLPGHLKSLYLDGIRLSRLPALPPDLVDLSVRNNWMQSFAAGLPPRLKTLDASGNPLMGLPVLPDSLERLDIHRTLVLELPATLPANLGYLNISHTDITRYSAGLRQAVERPGAPLMLVAEGITLSGQQPAAQANQPAVGTANFYGVGMNSTSLSQAVDAWYGGPDAARNEVWDRIYQENQDGLANATVPLWKLLDSLNGTADYPSEIGDTAATKEVRSEMRAAFKQRVVDLLDAMAEDKDLRKTCLDFANERVESCHDNVALGFDEMEQAHLAARAIKGEFPQNELFGLGIGRLKLLLLDELAIPKGNAVAIDAAAELNRPIYEVLETVEVVMAYRLALAEKLDLPTKTKHMRYYATAHVTEQDLLDAETKVNQAIADQGRVAAFMAGWRPWQVELERRHPEEFDREALSEAEDKLMDEMMELQISYDNFCKKEGELSVNALDTKEKINLLKPKFDTLEEEMFREPRERLTKVYMGVA